MTRYNVHLYREMRLYFPGIEAGSHEAAAEHARLLPPDQAGEKSEDCDGADIAALVDLEGDDEYAHSKLIDFAIVQPLSHKGASDVLEILRHAVETEEGNWDGPDDEPQWIAAARTALAADRGQQ